MRNQKGFAFICVMLFIAIIMIIGVSFVSFSYSGLNMADRGAGVYKAFYTAEAGLAKKFMDFRDGNLNALSENFTISTGVTGSYVATVTGASPLFTISSTGTYRGISKTVSMTVRQMSYAEYSYISNSEEALFWGPKGGNAGNVWFDTGDQIRGPLMTNDQLNIFGSPEFFGSVMSANATINYYHDPGVDAPIFHSTLTLGAPRIQMPVFGTAISTASQQAGGVYLNYSGTTQITINNNQTLTVENSNIAHPHVLTMNYPSNGAIYSTGTLAINSGIINGQLTIGGGGDIYIKGNILYNNDPQVNPDSTDMLGIVAASDVIIDSNTPRGSDLTINGYIVAQTGGFYLQNYSTTNAKGTLNLLGGLSQAARGPVGTFSSSSGNKLTGYTKSYVYDTRFANQTPSFFPYAVDQNGRYLYRKILWRET